MLPHYKSSIASCIALFSLFQVLVCLPNCLNKVSYKSTLVSAELQLDCEITLEPVQDFIGGIQSKVRHANT